MNKNTRRAKPRKTISSAALAATKRIQGNGNGSKSRQYAQAEKALRESEEKFRNLFKYAKDAIILADTQTGLIVDVNTAGCKMLGLPKKKIIGMHQSAIHPPELAEKYKKVFKGHVEKGVVNDEYMIVQRADGKQIPVDISTSLITTGDKTIIQGIFRDVSERLKMERALKESEEKISKAFRSIPEAVSIATLKDGVFLEVNDSFTSLNGYSRDEIIGHTGKELDIWVNPEDRYRMKQMISKKGHFENEEFLLRRKTGETRTVLLSADIITYEGKKCLLTLGTDITERKRIEEALRQSEAKYSSLVERSNDGIIIIENGVLKFINSKMAEMTGYTVEEAVGRKFIDFAAPEERKKLMAIHMKRMKGKDIPTKYEATIIARDGQHIHTEINAGLITYEGHPAVMAIVRDVTERKQVEQALIDEATRRKILIEQSRDGIVVLDIDGKVYEANQKFADMLGYTHDEVMKLHVFDWEFLYPPEKVVEMISTVDEKGDHFETQHRRKDGSIYDVEISTNGAMFAGQKLIFCVCRDITERKKMEQTLTDESTRRRILIEQSSDGIVILDQDGKVYDANQRFADMLGYSLEELRKLEIFDWSPPTPREPILESLRAVDEKGDHFETQHRRKDGSIYDVEISTNGAMFAGQKLIFCVCRDITERKKMEQSIRESEEKFSTAFHASPQTMIITRDRDDVTLEVNDYFTRITGFTHEETIGKTSKKLGVWQQSKDMAKLKQLIKDNGRVSNEEFEFLGKRGQKNTQLVSIEPITIGGEKCWLSILTDITERKRRENLQKAENYVFMLLSEGAELNEILDAIVRLCEENDPSIKGSVMLYDASTNLLKGSGPSLSEEYNAAMKTGISVGPVAGSSGTAAYRKKRVIIRNIKTSPLFKPFKEGIDLSTRNGLRAVWSEPIISSSGDLLGTITNYSDHVGGPNADNIRVLEWSARIAAIAIERKMIEKALKESEEKFSKAFHGMPEGVAIARIKDGVFIDVNESFCRDNNYTREEVIGHRGEELNLGITPSQRDEVTKILKKQGHVENMEFEFSKKSGEITTLLLSAESINIGGEPCLLTITSNITKRKQMEQALRESEERISKAFQAIPEAISIASLEDDVFLEVNDSFISFSGYSREEIIGHSTKEIVHWVNPDDYHRMKQLRDKRTQFKNEEFLLRRKSGEMITILMSGDMINFGGKPCILTVGTDITERKQMDQAIKESEEKYRNIVELAQDAIVSVNLKGQITACNEAFGRLTGASAKETVGKNFAELPFVRTEDISGYMEIFKSALAGEKIQPMEIEWNHPDRPTKVVELRISIMKNNGKVTGIHALILDITERKMMEQALKESEEKFSKAFHTIPEAISIARLKDGVFIDVNESFCRQNEYTREEVIGHSGKELITWADPNQREEFFKLVREKGHVKNIECEFRKKSGEIHTALMSADIVNIGGQTCVLSVTGDITERKQMEQAIKESEEKFSKAFHAIPETLSISTLKEGRFVDVNESFLKLNQLTREEVIGRTGEEMGFLKPGDERNKIRGLLKKRTKFNNEEIEFKAPISDNKLTFLFSADTIEIGGEPCLLIIGNDITKRKQAENELQQALTDLEQNSALLKATNKELESFSYSVSHDLRSPLRSIDGFSQALLEDYTDSLDEKGQDYLNRLRSASQKMGELIDGLLKLSRLTRSEMHFEKVDLSSLANEIATRLRETHDKRDVQFIIDNDLKTTGDPQMLRVLLENLLGNAWKFTKNTPKAKIEFGSTTENGTRTFFIKDNGAGFDMAFKDKLFGAFQRLHDAVEYPGTGIGLATVQRIINRHGGNIRAEGATGKGAGFYFTLN